jgi:hypothetical protein
MSLGTVYTVKKEGNCTDDIPGSLGYAGTRVWKPYHEVGAQLKGKRWCNYSPKAVSS